jgi:hypothetical protein
MPYDIYRNGSVEGDEPIMTVDSDTLAGADLSYEYLTGANLYQSDLSDADLSGANLTGASLSEADLTDADLSGADLTGASLYMANLTGTNLGGADLTGASMVVANLTGANLTSTILPNGETFEYFVQHTVPLLLTAGGKPLEVVTSDKNWACHNWDNCPIAVAFRTNNTAGVPEEYREAAELFITLFDAKLIPRPVTTGDNQDAV